MGAEPALRERDDETGWTPTPSELATPEPPDDDMMTLSGRQAATMRDAAAAGAPFCET